MKTTILRSNKGTKAVKQYVEAARNGKIPQLEIVLKPISEHKGFCIDRKFLAKVKKRVGRKDLDEEVCAHIVAIFLETFENKESRKVK